MNSKALRTPLRVSLVLAAFLLVCGTAIAQNDQVKGVINGRSGATMSVLSGGESITVVLTTDTQVLEPEGAFRKKHLTMTALVPGLAVEVKGSFNDKHQLVADRVTFHGSDLKTAQDIQAGLAPTQQQVQQNQQQIQAEQQKIQQQQQELQTEEAKTAANKRFGELGDYNILGEVTVLFGNGRVDIDPQYKPQLLKLAQQAMGVTGYVIQVKGYASKVGSAVLSSLSAFGASDDLDARSTRPHRANARAGSVYPSVGPA